MDRFEALQVGGHADIPSLVPPPPFWQRFAACAGMDPETFYPEKGGGTGDLRMARDVCGDCPVSRQCLDWAIEHDEHGMWAGTSREQRKAMRRQQAA